MIFMVGRAGKKMLLVNPCRSYFLDFLDLRVIITGGSGGIRLDLLVVFEHSSDLSENSNENGQHTKTTFLHCISVCRESDRVMPNRCQLRHVAQSLTRSDLTDDTWVIFDA